jgi:periplasmic divalent cation tolerance protein
MADALVIYTTWPDVETADRCARAAVEQGLAACANRFAPLHSVYRWEGAVETATEIPMIFKTTRARADTLRALIEAQHPYDLPCVVAIAPETEGSSPAFLAWIAAEAS